jgi:hypothetical protein
LILFHLKIKKLFENPFFYSFIIFVTYALAWLLEFYVIGSLQNQIPIINHQVVSLIFLPHGIRVMSIILLGQRALIPLFAVSVLTGLFLLDLEDAIILSLLSIFSLFVTLKMSKIHSLGMDVKNITLKNIIFISALSSILSSFLNSIFKYFNSSDFDSFLNILLTHTLGDISGAIVCFYLLGLMYKLFFVKKINYYSLK